MRYFLYAVLAISLLVNVVIIGGGGYFGVRIGGAFGSGPEGIDRGLMRIEENIVEELEGNDRNVVQDIFTDRRPALRDALVEWNKAYNDIEAALERNDSETAALTSALDRSERAASRLNRNFHGILRDMATGLSPEAREKIGHRFGDR